MTVIQSGWSCTVAVKAIFRQTLSNDCVLMRWGQRDGGSEVLGPGGRKNLLSLLLVSKKMIKVLAVFGVANVGFSHFTEIPNFRSSCQ